MPSFFNIITFVIPILGVYLCLTILLQLTTTGAAVFINGEIWATVEIALNSSTQLDETVVEFGSNEFN